MKKIELGYLSIDEKARSYVNDALNSNRLSAGKYMDAFEKRFAKDHDCRHAVMCNSGTSALQIALAAIKEKYGFRDGEEVLVPAITFIATSNIVLQNGMVPVFVDVDPLLYNIDPARVEEKITRKTRAIIPVHLFGLPCEMDPILAIAKRYGLKVIEDSCETMYARYKGRAVGSFGEIACFSTYVAHLLVTGVGGLITTQSDEFTIMARSILAHGRDSIYLNIDDDDQVSDQKRFSDIINRRFSFVRMGYSYRVTEMEAALGLAALEKATEMIEKRRNNAAYLIKELKPYESFLQLPIWPAHSTHSFMMLPIVLKEGEREPLVNYLERHGIETRFMLPLLNQPYYRSIFGELEEQYPVAQWINQQGFYIGCHQGLEKSDLDYVVEVFAAYFKTQNL
jgi:dTDP-4-amino-4,6-dideoxygalactose transaminase